MKKICLAQNLLRLAVALLVIVMLFLPFCSFKVMSLTEERVAQITAMGLIAVDRGDMTEEEFLDMMEIIAPIAEETGKIAVGKTPDDQDLPFDFIVNSEYPDNLVDNKSVEELEDQIYPLQSEIGNRDDKKEVSLSVFSMVKSLVSGGAFTFRLITTNILEDYELADTENMSDKQIEEIKEQIMENKEKSGFSDELIGKLSAIGVVNSETWVYLSKLDTGKLNEEVMNLVWLATSFTSITVIATILISVIAPITLLVLALGEIFKLIKKKFVAQGADEDSGLFQYCTPICLLVIVAFLNTGAKTSPIFFALLGVVVALAIFYSFTEGSVKQGKGNSTFFWIVRGISVLCLVACLVAGYVGMNYNTFENAVNEDTYQTNSEKVLENHKSEMDRLEDGKALALTDIETFEAEIALLRKSGSGEDVQAQIAELEQNISACEENLQQIEKDLDALNIKIKCESVSNTVSSIQWLKLLVMVYLIMVAGYLTDVVARLGSLRSTEYPQALVFAKYVGRIVCAALAAIAETFLFGGLVTPFVYFFAAMAVLEILLAIFKKVSRKFSYNYVVSRGQALCDAGVIPVDDWGIAFGRLEERKGKATSLMTVGVVDTIDGLLDEYELGEKSVYDLGKELQNAFDAKVDTDRKKKKKRR